MMTSWHFTKYRITPDSYRMASASQSLVDTQPSKRSEYGAVDAVHVDNEKDTVPMEHRDRLQKSGHVGPAPNVAQFHSEPKSYLSYAILATIFCCLPLGISAIYCARKAKTLARRGERMGSYKAAHKSRQLIQMAVAIGLVIWFIALVLVIAVVHHKH